MQDPTCQLFSSQSCASVVTQVLLQWLCVLWLHAAQLFVTQCKYRMYALAGKELDLRRFHEAIEECGGFDAAVTNKKFGRIAVKLGIDLAVATNAAYLLK